MSQTLSLFLVAWSFSQAASMLMIRLGSKVARYRVPLWIGRKAHRQKMIALERYWPLTKIRPAIERGDQGTCGLILSAMIALKSAGSFVFGIVMVFWLPVACLILPSIIAVHDPDDPRLDEWVRKVAALQLTSHAVAAALGFAVCAEGPLAGVPVLDVLADNAGLLLLGGAASLAFAFAAGKAEASGVIEHGV